MGVFDNAKWIKPKEDFGDICPIYKFEFDLPKVVKSAKLFITAMGVYEAHLNGKRIGNFVLAPGYTVYRERLQYQEYDITHMLDDKNELSVVVANGWYRMRKLWWAEKNELVCDFPCIIACIEVTFEDGSVKNFSTDKNWFVSESKNLYQDWYNGVKYDSRKQYLFEEVEVFDFPKNTLIHQQGEDVTEHETLLPKEYIITPKGERVIDFGQNLVGYVEFCGNAKAGDEISISHAEVLDSDGNFYTENYRSARAKIDYICQDGENRYKPSLNFYGFRYIRLDKVPEGFGKDNFKAIVVHSDIKQTGFLESGHKNLNQFFSNVIWGQKGNFVDIPTDCPQRDERFGWTGDVSAFVRTAAYQFDVEKFFEKWLVDVRLEQYEDGGVPRTVPNVFLNSPNSRNNTATSIWGDVAVICPWQIYLTYGNKKVLEDSFDSMRRWIDFISSGTDEDNIWISDCHCGDWLALDAGPGSFGGASNSAFVAAAYYANSVSILVKTGKILGKDVAKYEELYKDIVKGAQKRFPEYKTQTEHVLALRFNIAKDMKKTAKALYDMIKEKGHLTTGFAGTPHLLHALSENGYCELAYDLLLREEAPSWLFSVTKGATTVWEHWDSIREDGSFWNKSMNSFNHYAYGSAVDWVYSVAAGIREDENYPGFERVTIKPTPDKRLGYLNAEFNTRHGKIISKWAYREDGRVEYIIKTPMPATIIVGGKEYIFEDKADFEIVL